MRSDLQSNWTSKTKTDLIIEVWEKLDCESVGAAEIEAVETVVRDVFGPQAVDSPMRIARTLADEGAELRHSEIMELFVARISHRPYDAAFRNVLDTSDLVSTLRSLRDLDALRRKYAGNNDREGLRLVRETAIRGKEFAEETAARANIDLAEQQAAAEAAQWFSVWMQTPALFDQWIEMRIATDEFKERFGQLKRN
jgi:hypothetical protein